MEGAVTMRARSPKHPFLCDSRVPFQKLIYWRFRSNWRFRSISMARRPFRSPFRSFRSISNYFDHFDLFRSFRSISIYFDLFRSISIYFDLFRFISIDFDSFRFRHRNRQNISMARRPCRSFHHVTAKMAHDGG
jgi:hypothetical protein